MIPVNSPPKFPEEFFKEKKFHYHLEIRVDKECNVRVTRKGGEILFNNRSKFCSRGDYRVDVTAEFPNDIDMPILKVSIREPGFMPLEKGVALTHGVPNTLTVVMQDDHLYAGGP